MGAYGFLRFSFELFPQASVDLAPLLLVLAVIGIIYGAIVAAMQTDLKRVIAYSSVAHMGFVVLGIFSLTIIGIDGARLHDDQPPAHHRRAVPRRRHALRAAAHARDRRVPRHLEGRAGARRVVPRRRCSPASACPASPGFIGEFLSLSARSSCDRPYAVVATFGVILAAVYMLWAFQRAFTGKPTGENAKLRDVNLRELVVRRAAARAQPVPRPLPEAGARPHRADGEAR